MAEIVSKLQIILLYDPVTEQAQVLNTYTVGSDETGDTRTRNGAEDQRDVLEAEKAGTLETFLNSLATSAANHAGL